MRGASDRETTGRFRRRNSPYIYIFIHIYVYSILKSHLQKHRSKNVTF